MHVLTVDANLPQPAALEQAAAVLRGGGLVAFPTETVYGLGAHALDPVAVQRIYAAKGRPAYNPLIVHVPEVAAARALAARWPVEADALAERFWPGPLTLVLPAVDAIPSSVTAGLRTVGLRIPAHPVALGLLRSAAIPLAAPSANRSNRVSPTTAQHVVRGLGDQVDLVLDGGPCPVGIESTVLSLAGEVPALLRPGTISLEALRGVVGEVRVAGRGEGEEARPSPGMLDRHYAPAARVHLFATPARGEALTEAAEVAAAGARVGVIALGPARAGGAQVAEMPADPGAYAARLYATLHALEASGCEQIWIEEVPDEPRWSGVRDRVRRAAG